MTPDVAQLLGLRSFLGNLFFLQTIFTPVYGSDGALWSLAYELWYYVLFALGVVALRSHGMLRRVLCGLGFLAVARLVGWAIFALFPVWLLGALLALLPAPRLSAKLRTMASVAYAAVFFGLSRIHLPGLAQDYLLGALTFGLLWVLLSATQPARNTHGTRVSHALARFSYTLYVVHMPFLLLLTAYFAGDARWQATPAHLIGALGILGLTLLYAWLVAWLTEFRTDTVRRWVEARLGAR
jgi:peptidoglycan/LPS O-acetylase OafA/YrhL